MVITMTSVTSQTYRHPLQSSQIGPSIFTPTFARLQRYNGMSMGTKGLTSPLGVSSMVSTKGSTQPRIRRVVRFGRRRLARLQNDDSVKGGDAGAEEMSDSVDKSGNEKSMDGKEGTPDTRSNGAAESEMVENGETEANPPLALNEQNGNPLPDASMPGMGDGNGEDTTADQETTKSIKNGGTEADADANAEAEEKDSGDDEAKEDTAAEEEGGGDASVENDMIGTSEDAGEEVMTGDNELEDEKMPDSVGKADTTGSGETDLNEAESPTDAGVEMGEGAEGKLDTDTNGMTPGSDEAEGEVDSGSTATPDTTEEVGTTTDEESGADAGTDIPDANEVEKNETGDDSDDARVSDDLEDANNGMDDSTTSRKGKKSYSFAFNTSAEAEAAIASGSNDSPAPILTRQEKADGAGNVRGSYGYMDSQGLFRRVQYEADRNGFRAKVSSNEPGLSDAAGSPANVQLMLHPVPDQVRQAQPGSTDALRRNNTSAVDELMEAIGNGTISEEMLDEMMNGGATAGGVIGGINEDVIRVMTNELDGNDSGDLTDAGNDEINPETKAEESPVDEATNGETLDSANENRDAEVFTPESMSTDSNSGPANEDKTSSAVEMNDSEADLESRPQNGEGDVAAAVRLRSKSPSLWSARVRRRMLRRYRSKRNGRRSYRHGNAARLLRYKRHRSSSTRNRGVNRRLARNPYYRALKAARLQRLRKTSQLSASRLACGRRGSTRRSARTRSHYRRRTHQSGSRTVSAINRRSRHRSAANRINSRTNLSRFGVRSTSHNERSRRLLRLAAHRRAQASSSLSRHSARNRPRSIRTRSGRSRSPRTRLRLRSRYGLARPKRRSRSARRNRKSQSRFQSRRLSAASGRTPSKRRSASRRPAKSTKPVYFRIN